MSRILIAYASHYGQTEKIAKQLAAHLRQQGHEVALANARTTELPAPNGYDLVVLGSRVEAGHHASQIRKYIREHIAALETMPTAFFSVSMAAAGPHAGLDPDGYLETTFSDLSWRPSRAIAFAGGLPYRKYGFIMRFIMKRISRAAGRTTDTSQNHEMTDWDAVRRFAAELASATTADVGTRDAPGAHPPSVDRKGGGA
jgi:menaquinone-dependent protoporphyrinogen oxidase